LLHRANWAQINPGLYSSLDEKGAQVTMDDQKPEQSRSPVPQSEKNFLLSVNYLTLLDPFLNDAA
jgi:hypothetical protein